MTTQQESLVLFEMQHEKTVMLFAHAKIKELQACMIPHHENLIQFYIIAKNILLTFIS